MSSIKELIERIREEKIISLDLAGGLLNMSTDEST